MNYLIPFLFVATAARGGDLAEIVQVHKCEQRLGVDLVRTIVNMRTLRTHASHVNGMPTPALRTVLDAYLAGDFPDDVETHNDSPLPVFEIKAERKLDDEGSKHRLMVLKGSRDGAPAVIVHEEQIGDEPSVFKTIPLGEPALREVREALLEAYQIEDRLAPRMAEVSHLALFADDRLRIDPRRRGGFAETTYADVLEVAIRGHRHGQEWHLNLRREDDRGALVRILDEDLEKLTVFKKKKYRRARLRALRKLAERLENSTSTDEVIEIFLGVGDGRPDLEVFQILGERNVPDRALRMRADAATDDLLRLEFGSLDHERIERVGEGKSVWYEIRAPMRRLAELVYARVESSI